MKKLKIYLDTSVTNFYYAEDAPDYQKTTIDFFHNHIDKYDAYISEVVIYEINKTPRDDIRTMLLDVINRFPMTLLQSNRSDEATKLATLYIEKKAIPSKNFEDAMHIALSTIHEFDILLSWNFKHLANINRQMKINSINIEEGYLKSLNLTTPMELYYEKE